MADFINLKTFIALNFMSYETYLSLSVTPVKREITAGNLISIS